MNMMKKNGGFTLVELIVVIAILAILAGVAVPAYSGYIKKAQDAAVITELDAIQTAAQAANATAGEITKITVAADGKTITVSPASGKSFAKKFDDDFKLFKTGVTSVTDTEAGTVTSVEIVLTNSISNWANSSYVEAPTGMNAGATWTATGWANGVAK